MSAAWVKRSQEIDGKSWGGSVSGGSFRRVEEAFLRGGCDDGVFARKYQCGSESRAVIA